jgi:beta-lactamase class A
MRRAAALCIVIAAAAPSAAALDGPRSTRVVPTHAAFAAATRFARSRAGLVSFAVVDSTGRVRGRRANVPYPSASVVKAMLLVSYLRQAAWGRLPLDHGSLRELTSMIVVSDNDAATHVYARIGGDPMLDALAETAGMRSFSVRGYWSSAEITARDEAVLFSRLNALVPPRHRALARRLLSSIVRDQRWGIPHAAHGWHVFFKGGWGPDASGQLVHQVALLERGGTSLALAVLTDGNPSEAYGRATIEGIAARLLRGL